MDIKTVKNASIDSFRDNFNETVYIHVLFSAHDEETAEEFADGFYVGCLQSIYQARGGSWPFRLAASEKRDLDWYLGQKGLGVKEGYEWGAKHLNTLAALLY